MPKSFKSLFGQVVVALKARAATTGQREISRNGGGYPITIFLEQPAQKGPTLLHLIRPAIVGK